MENSMSFLQYGYNYLSASARQLLGSGRERGAISAEYVGILFVVAAIIVAVINADIGSTLVEEIGNALSDMFGGGGGDGGGGGPQPE